DARHCLKLPLDALVARSAGRRQCGEDAPLRSEAQCRHQPPWATVGRQMSPSPISLTTRAERWPIAGTFTISRGAKTEAAVVVAELSDGHHRGRGECVPYA